MRKIYAIALLCVCSVVSVWGQNVGIGTNTPDEKLDVNGNIKFSGGELSTDNIADIVPFYIRGTGNNNVSNRIYVIGSTVIYNSASRGLQLTIINKSDYSVVSNTNYDTYGNTSQSDALATAINGLTAGQIGVLTSYDAWEGAVTTNLDNAFKSHGLMKAFASNNNGSTNRKPYAAIFEGGVGINTAKVVEVMVPNSAIAPYAEIRGWYIGGSFVAAPTLPNALMNVDGTAIGLYVDENTNVNANGNTIQNVATPTNGTDAVNKNYVDGLVNKPVNSDYIISANLRHSTDDWCDGCSNTNSNVFSDGTDDARHVANLGFSITINGVSYSQVTICTNGWMAFGDVNTTTWTNTAIPSSSFSGPVLFPYWDDLKDFGSGEFIRYGTVGSSPNRVFISDWQMRTATGSGKVNFQVLVHESSGLMVVQYENEMEATSNGQSASVGFQTNSSKGYPLVFNGKIFDDNEDSQMSWSVCPIR